MLASPLCDIDAYVANFEALLRRMWDQHRAGGSGRLLAARTPPARCGGQHHFY